MVFAVALDYSPLDKKQQKSVLDYCTKELITPKGLRSLSPKSRKTAAKPTTRPTTTLSTSIWFLSDKRDIGLSFGIFIQK